MKKIAFIIAVTLLIGLGCQTSTPLSTNPTQIQDKETEIFNLAKQDLSEALPDAQPEDIEMYYGDVTGDGQEDAWVLIPSGGTAGIIAIDVYELQNNQVVLLQKFDGYKMDAEAKNGQLVITQPFYLDTDANCCPSFLDKTTYRWDGKKFVETGTERVSSQN